MTPKFLLPCTAWLTTFHALPRSDISDLTKRGSTFCLLAQKSKSSRSIFLSQEPLPCTAWLTTFHALPRSDISDLTKRGSTFCLLAQKSKSSRSIFLSQEPHFVYSPERQKAQDRSFSVKNLTLLTHPKSKSSRSIFLSQEPHFVYSPERQKPKIDLS